MSYKVPRYALPQVADPIDNFDIANKAYVDAQLTGFKTVVENYIEAAATNDSKVFTLPIVGDTFDITDEYILVITGAVDGACDILMRINGASGAGYYTYGRTISAAGNEVIEPVNAGSSFQCVPISITSANGRDFRCEIHISRNRIGDSRFNFYARCNGGGNVLGLITQGTQILENDLDTIEILTSANNWLLNTRMTLYRTTIL